jgi:hypothetical protein
MITKAIGFCGKITMRLLTNYRISNFVAQATQKITAHTTSGNYNFLCIRGLKLEKSSFSIFTEINGFHGGTKFPCN